MSEQQPNPGLEAIPKDLRDQLEELRPVLELQGVVQQHHGAGRRLSYRLRFRAADADGLTRHRSLEIGSDPAVADAVEDLIRGWREVREREEDERRKADEQKAKQAADEAKKEREGLLDLVLDLNECGIEARRRAHAKMKAAEAEGDLKLLRAALSEPWKKRKNTGRPRKSRLW